MPTRGISICASMLGGCALLVMAHAPGPVAARPLQQQTPPPPQQVPPPQQPKEVAVSLTNPGVQPKLGIPDFIIQGGDAKYRDAAATVANTLWNDLDFEQEFYVIDRKASAGIPAAANAAAIPYDRWEAIGADFVVLGVLRPTAAGFDVDVQVIGVRGALRGKQEHGQSYGPCTLSNARYCAHFVADDMHAKLRQLDGVARTKLAFSSDRGATRMLTRRLPDAGDAKEIYIADYDGANSTRVTANQSLNIAPVWGPDTRTLAYISYVSGFPDVYLTTFDGRAPSRPAGGSERNQNHMPVISPDGRRIAFASRQAGSMDIWVVDRDGRNKRNLTPASTGSDEVAPTWSPTGDRIAFTSDRSGRPAIYMMRSDGLNTERVYGDLHADRPTWSRLNFIAFTVVGAGTKDIALFDINSRSVRILTDGRGANESPSVSPNGRHIAFVTTRWGKEQIATVGIDGKKIRQVTNSGNNGWPNWSPSPAR